MLLAEKVSRGLSSIAAKMLLPVICGKGFFDKNWQSSLEERLGKGGWLDIRQPQEQPLIWFHAASVGEVGGLLPVIDQLRPRLEQSEVLFTTTSMTGQKEVRDKKLSNYCCLLPFDHPRIINSILKKVNPKLMVITETEIWPNLLYALNDHNIPVVIINGRISDYSYPRYLKLRKLIAPILQQLHLVLTQSAHDRERFVELGVPEAKAITVGCTKFDRKQVEFSSVQLAELYSTMGLNPEYPVFVMGSIRPGEDKVVIEAYARLIRDFPQLQAIVAPRHADNYGPVSEILASQNITFWRRSEGAAVNQNRVVLLDTMGELAKVYAASSFAFVGASLVNIGGHNPLEPAAYGKPVIMGPYNSNVREIVSDLKTSGGMAEVKNGDELESTIRKWLLNPQDCAIAGEEARKVWAKHQGATSRVVGYLNQFL